jgi:membrane associated rhomboid family serine protease
MILPLGDSPNPRGTPVVTYALIFLNCAVFALVTLPMSSLAPDPRDPLLAEYLRTMVQAIEGVNARQLLQQTSAYDLVVFQWGFRPSSPDVVTSFTAMFLHGGFMHLAGNMLFLWIYGDNVEHHLGKLAFLFWYLVTGVAATLVHALFAGGSPVPMVGASGAISGVLGFYFLWFPHNTVRLFVFLFPFLMTTVQVPARIVLGIYLVIDNLLPFAVARGVGAGGGVAYGAHIGGFVAGLAVAWMVNRRGVTARPDEYRRVAPAAVAVAPAALLGQTIDEGRFEEAARAYFALDAGQTRRLLGPRESLLLGNWLLENGHERAALVVYQRHVRDYPIGPGTAEAHVGAGLVQFYVLGQAAAAYQHFVDALGLDPAPATAERARAALAEIAALQKRRFGR